MDLFYELIQVALGNRDVLSKTPSAAEWSGLYQNCKKQAVAGVAFTALDSLSRQEQKPPLDILYQWLGYSEQIKRQNFIVNKHCVEITKLFAEAGFRTCVLKGQGNARMYKNPLSRSSGDIDLWILGHADLTDSADRVALRQKVDSFVHSRFPDIKGGKMHIEYPVFKDVAVEVHYIPSYMYTPRYDRRLQAFFREKSEEQFNNVITLEGAEGTCAVPTTEFNLVQQPSHLMSHFMGEGIGLRQLTDYYFILTHSTSDERKDAFKTLKSFGLGKFVATIMYIMRRVFDMDEELLLCEPNAAEGEFLLSEILRGGNFGQYDERNKHLPTVGHLKRGVENVKRNLRFLKHYPNEVLWAPVFKLWHWCWRKSKGYL